jgi:flagellar L-ring protein precursor FlgH
MMKRLLLFSIISTLVFAGSLWKEDTPSPYSPGVARHIGDIILIRIDESNTATQKAQTDLQKNTRLDGSVSWTDIAQAINSTQQTSGKAGLSAKNTFQGSGTTGRSSRLQGLLTAQIYRIEGNHFYIRGSKSIMINNEDEEISIEGMVRAEDLQSDNSIASSLISDAVLKIKGYGQVATEQERGFFARLVQWLF